MKSMKKMSLLLLLVIIIFGASGCGKGNNGNSGNAKNIEDKTTPTATATSETGSNDGEQKDPVVLKVWNWNAGSQADVLKKWADDFHELHPNVTIETQSPPDQEYAALLKTALTGGEGPDLFLTHGWNDLDNYLDFAEPLDGKIDFSNYSKEQLTPVLRKGKLYAIPGHEKQGLTVFYNKKLFQDNGMTVPKTYQEFVLLSEAFKSKGIAPISMGGADFISYHFALFVTAPSVLTTDWFEKMDSGQTDFTDPSFEQAIANLKEWGKKGYYQDNYEGTKFEAANILFKQGKAAMFMSGTWDITPLQKDAPELQLGAFTFPGETQIVGSSANGAGFTLNNKSKHQQEAIKFLQYISSQEGVQSAVTISKGIPALDGITGADPVAMEAGTAQHFTEFLFTPYNSFGKDNTNPQSVWQAELFDYLSDKIDIKKFTQDINSKWDKDGYVAQFSAQ